MTGPRRQRRGRGDDGAVLLELALVSPILVLFLLGIFEFGMGWRESQLLASASRGAVRSAAQAKTDTKADLLALQSLLAGMNGMKNVTLQKVIIYKVDITSNPDGDVPPACLTDPPPLVPGKPGTRGVSGVCTVYEEAKLTSATLVDGNFGCAPSKYDAAWCPNTRSKNMTGSGPTWIGMYVEVRYDTVTNLLKTDSITLQEKAVTRVEPDPTS